MSAIEDRLLQEAAELELKMALESRIRMAQIINAQLLARAKVSANEFAEVLEHLHLQGAADQLQVTINTDPLENQAPRLLGTSWSDYRETIAGKPEAETSSQAALPLSAPRPEPQDVPDQITGQDGKSTSANGHASGGEANGTPPETSNDPPKKKRGRPPKNKQT
ncbi:MAG: hypothetical protein ACFCD0_26220 [Gemmataceae bacterium]